MSYHDETIIKKNIDILLKSKVESNIDGLQLTELVPAYSDKEQRWTTEKSMKNVNSQACQIHHTHNDHWVSAMYYTLHVRSMHSIQSSHVREINPCG